MNDDDQSNAAMKGADQVCSLASVAACLHQNGYSFAMRYYCTTCPCDALTKPEYDELHKAGLKVGAVWEQKHVQTGPAHFTKANGEKDAEAAFDYAYKKIGQPKDTAIYFAVDFDATQPQLASIEDYFQGIASAQNPEHYVVGAYGSGLVLTTLVGKKLAEKTWLSGSMGWAGYDAYKSKCDILQVFDKGGPFHVCGVEVDDNEIAAGRNGGLF